MSVLRRKPLYDAIRGDKGGGGSQHTPTEAADTLRSTAYATILDLVSEGEIKGFALGSSKMGQCIALDGTLLENPDGTRNFSNVTVDSRAGTQGQDYIPGVPDVENSLSVGIELKAATPWVTRITNTNLSAVRIILSVPNGLQKSDQSNGDVTGYTVAYKIEMSIDDGVYATVLSGAFSGKASGKYQRAHRLNLPAADDHWNIRVTRVTANAASAMIADRTDVDAEVDIIDTKFRYPNSALVSISVDASQFSSIPTRAYLLEGRIVRIPSNYDPVSRTYTGVWDGTFKPGYTNNPAWCFFDMATHKRYGLGQFLNEAMVDKWKLYTIAQYCDQLVDDGNGGLEPRFTCFLYLQDKADAYKVMQDMATMFRGISYYAGSAIQAVADMPSDPVYAYDDTNVIGGKFSYSGSSRTSRQTVALVSWNDESDFSRAKVEYVEDLEGIARYGVRPTEVTAIGESRRSGAHRAGRHILFTNRLETEMVSFGVGLDGDIAAPGMIVKVTDHSRAGKRMGGRIKAATANVVTVDQAPDVEVGDTLSVNMPDGVLQVRAVSGVDGADITVGTPFTEAPQAEAVWAVEKTSLAAQLFRVVSVAENSETDEVPGFTLSCIQHAPEKFAAIDSGIILTPKPITSINVPTQAPVTSITIAQNVVFLQGIATTNLDISWDKPDGAVKYSVDWKKDDGGWISAGETVGQSIHVVNVYAGSYQARVIAFGSNGVPSVPVISSVFLIGGKDTKPPAPALSASGSFLSVDLTWEFPTTANVSDTSYTEVQTDISADMSAAVVSGTVPYPGNYLSVGGMAPGEIKYARARLVDKSGNIGEWSNLASASANSTDTLFKPIQDEIDDLQNSTDSTIAQVQVLQGQVGDILKADEWSQAKVYPLGDLVQKGGKLYRSLIDGNTGNDPATATADWELIGNYTSLGEAVGATAANVATLSNTVSQQGDTITSLSQSVDENAANIGAKADASALALTNAAVSQQGDEITASAADIALLGAHNAGKTAFNLNSNTVTIDGTQTMAQRLSSLQAGTDAVNSRVDGEQTARQNGDAANASAITAVSANSLNVGVNLFPNPDGVFGAGGWVRVNSNSTTAVAGKDSFGMAFHGAIVGNGTAGYISGKVGIAPQRKYSVGVSVCHAGLTSGQIVVDVVVYNSSGTAIGVHVYTDNSPSTAYKRGTLTFTSEAGADSLAVRVYITNGTGATQLNWKNVKLEQNDQPTAFSDNATSVSVAQAMSAAVNADGSVNALYSFALDVNGKVVGMVAQNNGTVGNIVFNADYVSFVKSNSSGSTNIAGGLIEVKDASGYPLVQIGMLP